MSHSTMPGLSLGSGRNRRSRHGVTMIEVRTRVDSVRRSKIAFWAVGSTVALTSGVIASAITTWPKAILIGLATGVAVGFAVALVLFCWPGLRVLWHWAVEITALSLFLGGFRLLSRVMPWWAALAFVLVVFGLPFAVGSVRRRLWALVMCAVSRHRLRVCFAAFVASQRTGLTPLILLARPIPAGERVWVWLRPGLAQADLEARLDRLAAGCWANECRIAPASRRYAALLRIDLARRNPLDGLVGSPLPGIVPATILRVQPLPANVPAGGLDLPDTPTPTQPPVSEPKRRLKAVADRPVTPAPVLEDIFTPSRGRDDDLADWI